MKKQQTPQFPLSDIGSVETEFLPPQVDEWIAASVTQKAIRRSDAITAERAALTLYRYRGPRIFRRIAVIATEDVGIGDVETVATTVELCRNKHLRQEAGGDAAVVQKLVRLLATSPKDRSADLAASIAHHHPALQATRSRIAELPLSERLHIAADTSAPLVDRLTASWLGSGLTWGGERPLAAGDLDALLRAHETLGVPVRFFDAVRSAGRLTREPLTILLPVIWHAALESRVETVAAPVPAFTYVGGIPTYGLDQHTRLGRAAFAAFARENSDVRSTFQRWVSKSNVLRALGLSAFYTDGSPCSHKLSWPLGRDLERTGIEADLLAAGVAQEGIDSLRETVARHLGHLNAIRERLLIAYLEGRSS